MRHGHELQGKRMNERARADSVNANEDASVFVFTLKACDSVRMTCQGTVPEP
jgi:hypothetical protein